jgi:hypothetical protein
VQTRLARFIAILAAVQILGGHWLLLQSAAWVGMMMDFARHDSLPVAIEKTFNGTHPCQLCKTVSKGRDAEHEQQMAKLAVQFEAVLAPRLVVPPPNEAPWIYPAHCRMACARTLAPPTPPPLVA